jgi:S1-C subfamily serine protease
MRVQEVDESRPCTPAEDDEPVAGPPVAGPPVAGPPVAGPPVAGPPVAGQAFLEAWRSKRFRISVIATAVILAAGVGFGVGRVMGLGNLVVLTAIPRPSTCQAWVPTSCAFIEDDDLTAQDNQENILESTAPGLVHILSGGTSVGIGMVLTESGKVLTTYRPAAGAANLSAEYVLSRVTFKAKVIGADPAAGLALLQLQGPKGRAFSTVTVGNSATLVKYTEASREASYHVPGEVYDTAIGTTGRENALSMDVGTLATLNTTVSVGRTTRSGLMASVLQSDMPSAIGGPLVNLNGQVIGITIGGSGSGLDIIGYAIPINTALAVATQIADGHS